jgi:predicted nucleic acid-binding protein
VPTPSAPYNVVDSSAWLAYLADEPAAGDFAAAIEDTAHLVVPTICLLEVFKVVARVRGEREAIATVAVMQQGTVVDLDADLALSAARLGGRHRLPLADSVIYATVERVGGTLWTQDDDFAGLAGVRYIPKEVP